MSAMLSDKAIQALRPDPGRPGTKHHDRDDLYLWVERSGSKTWRKGYRWRGARRTFTIGAYPAMRLADGRKQALELNTWIKTGIDPRTQAPSQQRKQVQNSRRPFAQIAQAWFEHHSASWSPHYCRDMREKLDHFVIPALGQLDIEGITRTDIESRLLAPILARGAHEQARRCPSARQMKCRPEPSARTLFNEGSDLRDQRQAVVPIVQVWGQAARHPRRSRQAAAAGAVEGRSEVSQTLRLQRQTDQLIR